MKPNCDKCEWHHLRAGYSYNWRTGEEQHNVMIDVCIHPILDDLKHTNFKGDKEYRVVKCEIRNKNQTCNYFQPKSSLIRKIIDTFTGKKIIDVYDRYNKLKTHTAYEFYKEA
jgi:hypothetical protein